MSDTHSMRPFAREENIPVLIQIHISSSFLQLHKYKAWKKSFHFAAV